MQAVVVLEPLYMFDSSFIALNFEFLSAHDWVDILYAVTYTNPWCWCSFFRYQLELIIDQAGTSLKHVFDANN